MEQQVLELLSATQSPAEAPRKAAERQLEALYPNEAFPVSLCSIASHTSVPLNLRQSALLVLKTFVLKAWSPSLDDYAGQVLVTDPTKAQLRDALLQIATNDEEGDGRKVRSAASYVISKIASVDFPEEWPTLLPTLLHIIPSGTRPQIHGALKVLGDLVEDGLNEDQFFQVARDLVKVVYDVAVKETEKPTLRALAISTFRSCFDILELQLDGHRAAVKAFADEALSAWLPFFTNILKIPFPQAPNENDETSESSVQEEWRGVVALKVQVVKTLMRIRGVFPALLSPQSLVLFSAIWQELTIMQEPYNVMYIEDERQGRLEDADGLAYTLDFLVQEELDFMQSCIRAPPVRKELEAQLKAAAAASPPPSTTWLIEAMQLAVTFAQITTEEEGLWDIDVNIFLSEETSVTANYTPRTACGDLVIKLGEWLNVMTTEGLLAYTKTVFETSQSWKPKEAALYIVNQLLGDFQDVDHSISAELAQGFSQYVDYAVKHENAFLRARGYLVAGVLLKTSGETLHHSGLGFMQQALAAFENDESEVVKVACIRVLQDYLQALPPSTLQPFQSQITTSISTFISSQDPSELTESDDLLVTLVETLRDTIRVDPRICLNPGQGPLDLLFTLARFGANNFQLTMLVNETFEMIAGSTLEYGGDAYVQLCEKVMPSLIAAFDVAAMTGEDSLTNLAADLLALLAEQGTSPLPQGFVATIMPKLNRLLLASTDGEFLRPATAAVKYMLVHDHVQFFAWRDPETNKAGLEICLIIIDRLLQESMDDHAAAEVGGLAAEMVEKAGGEQLGPYLLQLLRAVAVRLASAQKADFIQSLILVFARLSLVNAKDVIDFLAQVEVPVGDKTENGIQVVMAKWLENSVNFAGYDEIRQNVIALSKVYRLCDPRLAQTMVQGDLIISPSTDGRIMTRSKARAQPDRYTIIPVPLKIAKVLIQELSSASGAYPPIAGSRHQSTAGLSTVGGDVGSDAGPAAAAAAVAAVAADDAGSESSNEDWEDVPSTLDLGMPSTKAELMAWGAGLVGEGGGEGGYSQRQRDDETQAYLLDFFREVSSADIGGFMSGGVWAGLTDEERGKLAVLGG